MYILEPVPDGSSKAAGVLGGIGSDGGQCGALACRQRGVFSVLACVPLVPAEWVCGAFRAWVLRTFPETRSQVSHAFYTFADSAAFLFHFHHLLVDGNGWGFGY